MIQSHPWAARANTIFPHAVTLLPCLLPFLSSALGHVWKCVDMCFCMHVWAFSFSITMPVCVCVFVRVQCTCYSAHLHGNEKKGPILPQKHFNGRYCWVFMVCCGGFDSVIWPSGDLADLVFFPPFLSSHNFFTPSGVQLYCCFSFSLLIISFDLILCLWPLKLATKRQEHSKARCSCPDWSKGTLSTFSPCMGSDYVALFEIASCKDNCASRCCNKLMTVLT